ncbi:hypothetical protein [Streptomyces sp. P3]|uniref:hypothetical protein n=1 Tax=Streptomyces sp. P3 TaxID=2135430 RepID=UPI001573085F|nr:hypothetical protein [Streptomyces sp. P3]
MGCQRRTKLEAPDHQFELEPDLVVVAYSAVPRVVDAPVGVLPFRRDPGFLCVVNL